MTTEQQLIESKQKIEQLAQQRAELIAALELALEEMDSFQAYWTSPKMGMKRGTCKAQEQARAILAQCKEQP